MTWSNPMPLVHGVSPFVKALRLAAFLERWLEQPDVRDPGRWFARLLVHVNSPVMSASDHCYFVNRVQSCLDLYHAGERLVAVYQMGECALKLLQLHRGWRGSRGGSAGARTKRPYGTPIAART